MYLSRSIVLLLCLGTAARALSAAPALEPDDAVRLALRQNPGLKAARLLVAEAEARAGTRGRLANPELETELATGPQTDARVEIAVTQRFPLTSRLRREREISSLEIELARLEVMEKERQLAHAVRSAFHELASVREAIILAEKQSAIGQKLADSLGTAAEQGQASRLDAGLAEVNAGASEVTSAGLRAEAEIAAGRVAGLLGLPAGDEVATRGLPALPKAAPAPRAPGFRPDLEAAELALRSGALNVTLARAARWDDVGLGLFTEVERLDRETEKLVGVRVAIPLPLWQNGAGRIAVEKAAQQRRQHEMEALRRDVAQQVSTTHRALVVRLRAAQLAESRSLPAARRHLDDSQAAYERGEIALETLIRMRERLTDLEIAALAARKAYHLAHAEWIAALGSPETQK